MWQNEHSDELSMEFSTILASVSFIFFRNEQKKLDKKKRTRQLEYRVGHITQQESNQASLFNSHFSKYWFIGFSVRFFPLQREVRVLRGQEGRKFKEMTIISNHTHFQRNLDLQSINRPNVSIRMKSFQRLKEYIYINQAFLQISYRFRTLDSPMKM